MQTDRQTSSTADTTRERNSPGPIFLVVDDDPMVRKIVSRGLSKLEPQRIIEVEDGLAARDILSETPVDVVVTDVLMPNMSGLELMKWAQEHCPQPLWIVLSGLETFDAAVDALQLGAFDYLAKPPEVQRVRVAVRNALDQIELVRERQHLYDQLEDSNQQLAEKVQQLEQVCNVLDEQAAVIQSDLDRAEIIQRALLPQDPPDFDDWCVETLYRSGNNVGGDLYDVVLLDQDHVGLVVADAAGHGVAAAMLSVLFKLRLNLRAGGGSLLMPNQVLETLNRRIHESISAPGAFITAVYVLLNRHTGWTRIASAGHPPCIIANSEGEVRQLERTGPALGLSAEAEYSEHKILLDTGDRLLLYTDGVLAQGCNTETSDAVAHIMGSGIERTALPGLLYQEATTDATVERDDITMILLERAEGESHFNDAPATGEEPPPEPVPAEQAPAALSQGKLGDRAYIKIHGTVGWTLSQTFLESAQAALEESGQLVIDLTSCTYLDSTCLGTLHEVVTSRPGQVSIQGMSIEIRALFEELSMQAVLDQATSEAGALPEQMESLQEVNLDAAGQGARMLRAHELLASLSADNLEKFESVVAALRTDLDQQE